MEKKDSQNVIFSVFRGRCKIKGDLFLIGIICEFLIV